jgi:uncharacterized protein YdeI (YjbR/CyaY-like superfamily)
MEELYKKSAPEWRSWLASHYDKSKGVWLVFYKKDSGKPTLEYEEAIEEALCYGWVDSIIRKIDDQRYARKFTPRKDESKWSELNKKRVRKLIREKRMADPGLNKVKIAQKNGMWDKPDRPQISFELPEDFKLALNDNSTAGEHFNRLAPSYQKQYIGWISVAKRAETREKRIAESIRLLERGEKLGMK